MSNYKNPFEPGGKFHNPRITDASRVTEPRIMPRWVEKEQKQAQQILGTKFYDINTGELIEQIEDFFDRVIATNTQKYYQLKEEFNNSIELTPNLSENLKNFKLTEHIISEWGINLNLKSKEFNDLAGTLYAEGSGNNSQWEEAAAMYSVLENRRKAIFRTKKKNLTIFEVIENTRIDGWSARNKINSKLASEFAKLNAQKGLILAIVNEIDYSKGAYYWHGTDFSKPTSGSVAHESFYLVGFKFTDPLHDIWNLGDKIKHGSNTVYISNQAVLKEWDYKYQSTAVFGKTTFMKLTEEYKNAQYNDIYENHNPY